jgi:hypothetical protein
MGFTNHVLCKSSVIPVASLKPKKHTISFTPTQSGIKSVRTVRAAVLKGIIDDSRVNYLFTKPNPMHTTKTLKQNEINFLLDINKKI